MKLRPVTADDSEALLALWNRNVRFDPLTASLLAEKMFLDPDYSPELAWVAEEDGRPVGFIVGVLRRTGQSATGYIKLLAVDEPFRNKGIGSALLRQIETTLFEKGASEIRLFESGPNYLTPGLDPRYTFALLFFEKHGYQRFSETWNLEVDLTRQAFATESEEALLLAQGIEIRRAEAKDQNALMEFLTTENWAAWHGEAGRTFSNSPISLHVALLEGNFIGFAGYDGNNVGTGWFGPMGTTVAARGKGVGAVLLRRCLKDIKNQGRKTAIIPWVGPIKFYARHASAQVSRVFYRFKKARP